MKEINLELTQWPYGLKVQTSAKGLLLTPRLKARSGWEKAFSRKGTRKDELASFRQTANQFDTTDWKW